MVETKAKASNKCSRPRCRNDAASRRAKFCTECFKTNASCASSKRKVFGGNTTTARGKGVLGNRGNASGKGTLGNKGNTTTGQKKKEAGKRSALRRSTKHAEAEQEVVDCQAQIEIFDGELAQARKTARALAR